VSVLYVMTPIALALAGLAVGAFLWAARDGQFDDVDTPPERVLFDDEPARDQTGADEVRCGAPEARGRAVLRDGAKRRAGG
jgi:cbb3-type cytochrome oxidase maturation protein